ncbi:MAG TPA: UPF0175 family protein [Dehalococcoidia bacterium]|nr:UPF0175 family protein [Dehalococcoidia bacterium]
MPDDTLELLGSSEAAAVKAKQALILDLLREARISQGKAAHLLGLTRGEILDLMAAHRIPAGPATEVELAAEMNVIRAILRAAGE